MPQEASGWQQWQSELQQAFRLYTLALAGVPEYGAMNRMKEQTGLSIQAKWRLAAAYALTGKMKPAEELVYNVETTVNPYSSMNQIYGSSDRDEAMILETLILMNRERMLYNKRKSFLRICHKRIGSVHNLPLCSDGNGTSGRKVIRHTGFCMVMER